MKTHVVTIVAAGDVSERKVDSAERVILKTATDMWSWKVGELNRLTFEADSAGGRVFVQRQDAQGDPAGAEWRRVATGARIEFSPGDERYPVSELGSLVLAIIPPPEPAEPEPLSPVWRVRFEDGAEELTDDLHSTELRGVYYAASFDEPWRREGRERSWRLDDERIVAIERIPAEELVQLRETETAGVA